MLPIKTKNGDQLWPPFFAFPFGCQRDSSVNNDRSVVGAVWQQRISLLSEL